MKISEIYTTIEAGNLLDGDEGYVAMCAIELLARVEGVPVLALDLAAPSFALAYHFEKRDIRGWRGVAHYLAWRACILNVQMLAAPGDIDGDPWRSICRIEQFATKSSNAVLTDMALYLPAQTHPTDVTDALIRATYERLEGSERLRFRASVYALRRLFDFEMARQSGLLPAVQPIPCEATRPQRCRRPIGRAANLAQLCKFHPARNRGA